MLTTKKQAISQGSVPPADSPEGPAHQPATNHRWRIGLGIGVAAVAIVTGFATGCSPTGPKALLKGESLIKAGQPQKAIPLLKRATEDLPEKAQAWNHLGIAYHLVGDRDNAISAYERALQKDRNLAIVHHNLGLLHEESGNVAGALESFTRYIILQPSATNAWLNLGLAQVRSRQWDAAERSLQYYLRFHPKSPEALNGMGLILSQRKKHREAYTYFQAASQSRPPFAPAVLNMATVTFQNLNNRPFALQKFRDYLTLEPDSPQATGVKTIVAHLDAELNPPARPQPANQALASAVTNAIRNLSAAGSNTIAPAASNVLAHAGIHSNVPALRPPAGEVRIQVPPTNLQPPQTQAVTAVRTAAQTNAATVAAVVTSNAPQVAVAVKPPTVSVPAAAPSVKPPVVPQAEPAPAPVKQAQEQLPVKIVESSDEPARVVADTKPAPIPPPVPANEPGASDTTAPDTNTTTNTDGEAVARAAEAAAARGKTEKPGFFNRLNPQGWFKKSEKPPTPLSRNPQPRSTPLNPPPTEKPSTETAPPVASLPLPEARSDRTPLPVTPVFASYSYLSPRAPAAGNRAQAETLFSEGARSQNQGRITTAITQYRSAIQADPSYFEAHYNLAIATGQAGETLTSLRAYEQALAVQPKSLAARFNFALALQKANYPADAARELERLIQDHPEQGRAYFALANLYSQTLGRTDLARKNYLKVLEVEQAHPQAVAIRQWLAAHP